MLHNSFVALLWRNQWYQEYTPSNTMIVPRLIERKRDGGRLERRRMAGADRRRMRRADVPDYQMSALLMAVFFQRARRGETNALTDSMLGSGGARPIASRRSRGSTSIPPAE